ncbi:MAG: hypothetical protein JWO57_894 [Pseudonocardiales bacterium]|nr:hypothetical protein [Pseudonocardiales bacterium]
MIAGTGAGLAMVLIALSALAAISIAEGNKRRR